MTNEQMIKQLEELIDDRESFIISDPEHDEIYIKDIDALKAAIDIIGESNVKRGITRLIDADALDIEITALIEEFERRTPVWSPNDMLSSGRDAALKYGYKADGAKVVLNIVREMPTVDAAPVKHGAWTEKKHSCMKWLPDDDDDIVEDEVEIEDMIEQKCSVCQRWAMKVAHHIEMNFCPHCGARMDGDTNG